MKPNDETNDANEHHMVKNPNWREADQLAMYNSSSVVRAELEPATFGFERETLWAEKFMCWVSLVNTVHKRYLSAEYSTRRVPKKNQVKPRPFLSRLRSVKIVC